jgi:hypothetical protein
VQYFWKTVGGSRQNSAGQWQVLCNRGVVVKITLGGNGTESEYVMHPGDVNWMDGGHEEGCEWEVVHRWDPGERSCESLDASYVQLGAVLMELR